VQQFSEFQKMELSSRILHQITFIVILLLRSMKYRSRTEIISLILDSTTAGATKTKIMYKAYLSYTQLKEYLSFLEGNELIRYEEGTQVYRITDKGRKFVSVYSEIGEMVSLKPEGNLTKLVI